METKMETKKDKKLIRKQILEKKKAVDNLINTASSLRDPLDSFAPFRQFNRNGLSAKLVSNLGDKLSSSEKHYIQHLLKVNMEAAYGSEWPTEEKVKRREMVSPQARYIFVHQAPSTDVDTISKMEAIVGFVHYRFTLEEEIPVVYVYEIQLDSRVQGKGLGKFLMQLIELLARKNGMGAVVLTVQKANLSAMSFYLSKLRYVVSSISPSKVDPLNGVEKSYEILCKAFSSEAKSALEEGV